MILSCPQPGLSCPKEKKSRQKRSVNFQKAISEKCMLWVPMEHWEPCPGTGWDLLLCPRKPPRLLVVSRVRKPRAGGRGWLVQSFSGLTVQGQAPAPPTCLASPGPAVGQYASPDTKRCCQDGMTKLPMARTCEQRAARVPQPACREPFLSCCKFAEDLRRNQTRSLAGLARGEQPGEVEGWAVKP